jgi:hypothetical protein
VQMGIFRKNHLYISGDPKHSNYLKNLPLCQGLFCNSYLKNKPQV